MSILEKITAPFRRKRIDIGQVIAELLSDHAIGGSYESRVREGYRKNGTVFRSLGLLQKNAGLVPWILFRSLGGGEEEEIEDHPILDLFARPNPRQAKGRWLEELVGFLYIGGRTYIHRINNPDGTPAELYNRRPDWVTPRLDKKGQVVAWVYKKGTPAEATWRPEEVLQLSLFDPLQDGEAVSPIEPSAFNVSQSNFSHQWNMTLLKNAGKRSIAVRSEIPLDDDEIERIKEKLKETSLGYKHAGEPLVFSAGSTIGREIQELGLKPTEMDWLRGQEQAERGISTAMGVPPQLTGDTGSQTFSNYREARESLWQEEVVPLVEWLVGEFNVWLITGTHAVKEWAGLELRPDFDGIDALQEDQSKSWERVDKSRELTVNEKRKAKGYEPLEGPAGSYVILDRGSFIDDAGEYHKGTEGPSATEERDEEKGTKPQLQGKALTLDQRAGRVKQMEASRAESVRVVDGWARGAFEKQRKAVVAVIRKAVSVLDAPTAASQEIITTTGELFRQLLADVYLRIGQDFGDAILRGFGKSGPPLRTLPGVYPHFPTKAERDEVLQFLRAYLAEVGGEKITQISNTTREQVARQLTLGINAGEGTDQLAKRIDKLFLEEIIPNRSEVIARTETIAASNAGSQAGARALKQPMNKEWISVQDDRTRGVEDTDAHDHVGLDGQVVDLETAYTDPRSGAQLMFPGDSSLGAPAGAVIQCRCTEGYLPK
jgi:HK97 family phage portal protein